MNKKLGLILILPLMVTTILGGCGSKKEATAVSAPQNAGATTQQTSLQKIDITKQQGQTEVDKGLDQQLQSLDSALDKLDKSMGSL